MSAPAMKTRVFGLVFVSFAALWPATLQAHSGPPFPIVSDKVVGRYEISVWTDPDSTDDRSAQGKFWVTLKPVTGKTRVPADTRVDVTIRPLDRAGAPQQGSALAVPQNDAQHFVALLMDHEGPFGVHVTVDGVLGQAEVDASTDATYDLRPRPILTALFLMPFLLVGFIWGKLLLKRRMHAREGSNGQSRDRRKPEQDSQQPGENRAQSEAHHRKSNADSREA
jgi:hypothetical protein